MTPPSLRRLEACHRALIGALDAHDVEKLEAALAQFREAVDEVRAAGGWRDHPEIIDRVVRIYQLSEAARIRVNFLTDMNRQRIEALAAVRGRATGAPYRRDGSLAA